MPVNRTIRIVALVVLLVSAVQIGMCALDCNCFLPSARGISARSLADADGCGDSDGCICCAPCGQVRALMQMPGLTATNFLRPSPPLYAALVDISLPYHPPRC